MSGGWFLECLAYFALGLLSLRNGWRAGSGFSRITPGVQKNADRKRPRMIVTWWAEVIHQTVELLGLGHPTINLQFGDGIFIPPKRWFGSWFIIGFSGLPQFKSMMILQAATFQQSQHLIDPEERWLCPFAAMTSLSWWPQAVQVDGWWFRMLVISNIPVERHAWLGYVGFCISSLNRFQNTARKLTLNILPKWKTGRPMWWFLGLQGFQYSYQSTPIEYRHITYVCMYVCMYIYIYMYTYSIHIHMHVLSFLLPFLIILYIYISLSLSLSLSLAL